MEESPPNHVCPPEREDCRTCEVARQNPFIPQIEVSESRPKTWIAQVKVLAAKSTAGKQYSNDYSGHKSYGGVSIDSQADYDVGDGTGSTFYLPLPDPPTPRLNSNDYSGHKSYGGVSIDSQADYDVGDGTGSTFYLPLPDPPTPRPPQCSDMPEQLRFDCYPEGSTSKASCERRGCCWLPDVKGDPARDPPLNVPYCFYPALYPSYIVMNVSDAEYGKTLFLTRVYASGYPSDVPLLRVDVKFETDSRLRVKVRLGLVAILERQNDGKYARIYDPLKKRYEVPWPQVPDVRTAAKNPLYEFDYSFRPFGFRVIRKDNGQVV
ncbi:unnamed protein product [Notodromas monacha]|uniref:P-type domain-containing protein n=1 Tax=Notodromas monacha TaxID=399045 RepID=A0A7R9BMK4_9CRUS|nr:unnamed protein product [Notodromas monacha]CAG0918269.1 unnamed protein product [Notodromas monacha]